MALNSIRRKTFCPPSNFTCALESFFFKGMCSGLQSGSRRIGRSTQGQQAHFLTASPSRQERVLSRPGGAEALRPSPSLSAMAERTWPGPKPMDSSKMFEVLRSVKSFPNNDTKSFTSIYKFQVIAGLLKGNQCITSRPRAFSHWRKVFFVRSTAFKGTPLGYSSCKSRGVKPFKRSPQ